MVGVFFLAMTVEGISKLRQVCLDRARRRSGTEGKNRLCNLELLRTALTGLRGLQAFFGYILMLAAMTFSLEMILVVTVGLSLGYVLFFQTDRNYLGELVVKDTAQEDGVLSCDFVVEESAPIYSKIKKETTDDENGTTRPGESNNV